MFFLLHSQTQDNQPDQDRRTRWQKDNQPAGIASDRTNRTLGHGATLFDSLLLLQFQIGGFDVQSTLLVRLRLLDSNVLCPRIQTRVVLDGFDS